MAEKTTKTALTDTKRASAALSNALEDVRVRIIAAQDRRCAIERAPVSQALALERLNAWAERTKATAFQRIDTERFASRTYREPAAGDMLDVLLAASAAQVVQVMATRIRSAYGAAPGLTEAERAAQLVETDAALLDMELAEESIIRSAEAGGFTIMRRADADPRAVLAPQEALP